MTTTAPANDAISAMMSGAKIARRHRNDLPVSQIVINPEENYRWGSREAMMADLASVDAEGVCTYERFRESIRAGGVQEPIGVVEREDGFHPIYGFTRAYAARDVGATTVSAYIYPDSIAADMITLLQMRENGTNLKRAVNWVAEASRFRDLVDSLAKAYAAKPREDRPKHADGTAMSPRDAAESELSKSLGVSASQMRNKLFVFNKVHVNVQTLAKSGALSYPATCEFYSGDADAPFRDDFIEAVLDILCPGGTAPAKITPDAIRQARSKVEDSGKARRFDDGAMPRTADSALNDRPSPGVCRDACIELARRDLRDKGLRLGRLGSIMATAAQAASVEVVDAISSSLVWSRIIGVGLGSGDVVPFFPKDSRSEARHEQTGFDYALTAYCYACASEVFAANGKDFDAWVSGKTTTASGVTLNRTTIHRLVASVVRVAGRRVHPALAKLLSADGQLVSIAKGA